MAQPQLRIACSLAAEKEVPGWPKALESAASEAALEHPRQWWGATWAGSFLWGAEPPRDARRTPRGGAGAGAELGHCRGDARERAAVLLVIIRVEDPMANRAMEGGVVLH